MNRTVNHMGVLFLLTITAVACASRSSREMVLEPVARPGLRIDRSGRHVAAGQVSKDFILSSALRMSQSAETQARIISVSVMIANESSDTVRFGPSDVFLIDSSKTLLFRLSETWLNSYYESVKAEVPMGQYVPVHVPPRSYVYSGTTTRIGNYYYHTGVLRADPHAQLASGLANLLTAAIVAGQRAYAKQRIAQIEEARKQTAAFLLRESQILPLTTHQGYVYFYNPPERRLVFPLLLVVKIGDDLFGVEYNEGE